jgi:preprotein translocase subunit YajC
MLTDALNFGQTLVITTPGQPTGGAIGTVSSLGDLQLQFNTQSGTTMTIPYYFITNVEVIGSPTET